MKMKLFYANYFISVLKGLKVKVRKFLRLVPMFVEVAKKKLVRGGGGDLLQSPILHRVNNLTYR